MRSSPAIRRRRSPSVKTPTRRPRRSTTLTLPDLARAIYHVMPNVTPTPDSRWALGRVDTTYRGEVQWGGSKTDYYRVNTETGERTLIEKALTRTMGNSPDVGIAYQALWRAGTVVTPANFLLPAEDLRHVIADAQATAVITSPEFADKVREATAELDHVRHTVSTGEVDGFVPLAALEESEPGAIVPREDGDLAALLYTGGTTGRSKGVMLTHANLAYTGEAAHRSAYVPGINRVLGTLPLSHAYGLLVTIAGLYNPERTVGVLLRWFDPTLFDTTSYDRIKGRDVPYIAFRDRTGQWARVYVLHRNGPFKLKDLEGFQGSNCQARVYDDEQKFRDVVFVVVHTGPDLRPFLVDRPVNGIPNA